MGEKSRRKRRACVGKQPHETKAEAEAHRLSLLLKQRTLVQVYKCQRCGKYHVGHFWRTKRRSR